MSITSGKKKHVVGKELFGKVRGKFRIRDTPPKIPEDRPRKRPVGPTQNWVAYNKAQANEIEYFNSILAELVSMVEEPEQVMGRPRLLLSDQIYCAVLKVYCQKSSRRSQTLYREAKERNHVQHAPHYNAISKLLLREDITPILHQLIHLSALPLAIVEKTVAIDSTGFRCASFNRYHEEKHGVKKEHDWIKANACCGVGSNIVIDVSITDGHSGDSPEFEGLLRRTVANGFEITEVLADKAYLSRDNFNVAAELGAVAYIPFKSNSTGRKMGSPLWKKMYFEHLLHNEEYMEHYYKRSNVESTFGAIKQKFGENLKSKKPVSQKNELLCKILAYNITVLIHEMVGERIMIELRDY